LFHELFHRVTLCAYSNWILGPVRLGGNDSRAELKNRSSISSAQKKAARTFSVRAGRPVTQLTSNSEAASSTGSFTGIYTP
jgi:hypothetical protein